MTASDHAAEMGASHSHVPANIVGKLIVLGIVLAFSFAAPAAPAARAIGARITDQQQDRQNASSVRPHLSAAKHAPTERRMEK